MLGKLRKAHALPVEKPVGSWGAGGSCFPSRGEASGAVLTPACCGAFSVLGHACFL